jgi:hypothetical protein
MLMNAERLINVKCLILWLPDGSHPIRYHQISTKESDDIRQWELAESTNFQQSECAGPGNNLSFRFWWLLQSMFKGGGGDPWIFGFFRSIVYNNFRKNRQPPPQVLPLRDTPDSSDHTSCFSRRRITIKKNSIRFLILIICLIFVGKMWLQKLMFHKSSECPELLERQEKKHTCH